MEGRGGGGGWKGGCSRWPFIHKVRLSIVKYVSYHITTSTRCCTPPSSGTWQSMPCKKFCQERLVLTILFWCWGEIISLSTNIMYLDLTLNKLSTSLYQQANRFILLFRHMRTEDDPTYTLSGSTIHQVRLCLYPGWSIVLGNANSGVFRREHFLVIFHCC